MGYELNMKVSRDRIFEFLAAVLLCHYTLFDYFRVAINILPVGDILSKFFFPVLYMFLLLFSMSPKLIGRISVMDMLIIIYFVLAILFSILIYPVNASFIADRLTISILPCLPFFLLGICLVYKKDTLSFLADFSCMAIAISALYIFYYMSTGHKLDGDEMGRSYALLPNVLIVMASAKVYQKKRHYIFSAIGLIYVLAMGTRGPIMVALAYLLICLWQRIKMNTGGKFTLFAVLGGGMFVFSQSALYVKLMLWISDILKQFGLSTRIIEFTLKGEMISETTGRDKIFNKLLDLLKERPLTGYGVYGEWQFVNYSAHNIYLETVFQYGWIVGVIMIGLYVLTVIKALRMCKNDSAKQMILAWSCFVFLRGFYGGELLSTSVFFLLGMCLREIRVAQRENRGVAAYD